MTNSKNPKTLCLGPQKTHTTLPSMENRIKTRSKYYFEISFAFYLCSHYNHCISTHFTLYSFTLLVSLCYTLNKSIAHHHQKINSSLLQKLISALRGLRRGCLLVGIVGLGPTEHGGRIGHIVILAAKIGQIHTGRMVRVMVMICGVDLMVHRVTINACRGGQGR